MKPLCEYEIIKAADLIDALGNTEKLFRVEILIFLLGWQGSRFGLQDFRFVETSLRVGEVQGMEQFRWSSISLRIRQLGIEDQERMTRIEFETSPKMWTGYAFYKPDKWAGLALTWHSRGVALFPCNCPLTIYKSIGMAFAICNKKAFSKLTCNYLRKH
jgi:hypothetical protein